MSANVGICDWPNSDGRKDIVTSEPSSRLLQCKPAIKGAQPC